MCEVCPMVSAVKSVYDEPVHISLSRLHFLLICSVQQAVVLQGDVFYILQSGLWCMACCGFEHGHWLGCGNVWHVMLTVWHCTGVVWHVYAKAHILLPRLRVMGSLQLCLI